MNVIILFLLIYGYSVSIYVFLKYKINLDTSMSVLFGTFGGIIWGVILNWVFLSESYWWFAGLLIVSLFISAPMLDFYSELEKQRKADAKKQKIDKEQPKQQSSKPFKQSNTISFSYEDADGNITFRTIDIHSVDSRYIEGYCHDRKATRTFRIDRVLGSIHIGSQIVPIDEWLASRGIKQSNFYSSYNQSKTPKPELLEVCFTGFKAVEKAELVELAEDYGFTVRASVTKNLNYLVCGDNAGWEKKEKAIDNGTMIIDKDDFIEMIETGEIPDV